MVFPWGGLVCCGYWRRRGSLLATDGVLLAAEGSLQAANKRLLAACEQLHKYNTSTRQNIASHIRTSAAFISRIAFNRK